MVVADGPGLPIGLPVARARPHDLPLAVPTLATLNVPQRRGRPRTRPQELVADQAYDSQACRRQRRRRGIKPTMPPVARRRQRPTRGRPIRPGPSDRDRGKVERGLAWMDNGRRLVGRDERDVEHDKALCVIAIILWCVSLMLK
jgi:hypothetical protein